MVNIIARHIGIFNFHGCTRDDISQSRNNFIVAKHHNLLNGIQRRAVKGGGWIRPTEVYFQIGVGSGNCREIGRQGRRLVVDPSRDEVEHGIGGMRVRRIIDKIPAIRATAPAQIEVEHIVVVVAIANESMATIIFTAAVIHWPAHVELLAYHGLPNLGFKVIARELHVGITIVEIGMHNAWDGARTATATVGTITHINGHAAMEAQGASGEFLSLGGIAVQRVGHIVPIISGITEVRTNLAIILMNITMAAVAFGRISPKTHQLRHRRGETTHVGMSARTSRVFWAAIVVWIILIPLGLTKITRATTAVTRDESAMLKYRVPFRSNFRRGNSRTQLQHTLSHAIQIIGQRGRYIGSIKCRLVRVTDDRAVRIVARNDDEAVFASVEDIKCAIDSCVNEIRQGAFHCKLHCSKFLCRRQSQTAVNGFGLKIHYADNQHKKR